MSEELGLDRTYGWAESWAMARMRSRTKIVAGVVVLAAIVVAVLVKNGSERVGYRLPVGKGTPMISLGPTHGLILASDGSLWSWGSDYYGVSLLGLGNLPTNSTSLRRIGNDSNWISICAGMMRDLAVKSDGTLWTWGESSQDSSGNPKFFGTPVPAAPGNDWKQAVGGYFQTVALKRDGTLWAWGYGWLGNGVTNGSSTPVQVGSATSWVKIWASNSETVGMQSDGSLWHWGQSVYMPSGLIGPILTPTRINADTNWMNVGLDGNTVFAIKSDGTLWAWGVGADLYTGGDKETNATPSRVGTDSDWRAISAGEGSWGRGLIKKDGSLWVMEKLDDKTQSSQSSHGLERFRQIHWQKDCAAYVGGETMIPIPDAGWPGPVGVVLTPDGEAWTWGAVLGEPLPEYGRWGFLTARVAGFFHLNFSFGPPLEVRDEPRRLRVIEPEGQTNP